MLEVGKSYRLNLRGGIEVAIVGNGDAGTEHGYYLDTSEDEYRGPFFVGISRDDTTDWIGIYAPDGQRIWEEEQSTQRPEYNLIMPRGYVDLDNALSLIRSSLSQGECNYDRIAADLRSMPVREL